MIATLQVVDALTYPLLYMREVNPNIFLSIPPSGLSCLLSTIFFSPSIFLPYMSTNPLALVVLESAQVYVFGLFRSFRKYYFKVIADMLGQ